MEQQVIDRRTDSRFTPPDANAARATLRPGCVVALVDVSRGGALVEGPRPMRPGARVHLLVATAAKTFSIEAHVLGCVVWTSSASKSRRLRGAPRRGSRRSSNRRSMSTTGSAGRYRWARKARRCSSNWNMPMAAGCGSAAPMAPRR